MFHGHDPAFYTHERSGDLPIYAQNFERILEFQERLHRTMEGDVIKTIPLVMHRECAGSYLDVSDVRHFMKAL